MTDAQRRKPLGSTLAGSAFVGAIIGLSMGAPAPADASPCDPVGMAMTPQPVLSCPPPDAPPVDGVPVSGPLNVAAPQPPGALPAPGQAPYVPPVDSGDGPAPGSQLGYLREIWHEFHNGVPLEYLPGPAAPPPANGPVPPE